MAEIESLYAREAYSNIRKRMVDQHWMIVGYWVENKWYGQRIKIDSSIAAELQQGQMIEVYFDQSNPQNARPVMIPASVNANKFQALGGFLMLFVGCQLFIVTAFRPRPELPYGIEEMVL